MKAEFKIAKKKERNRWDGSAVCARWIVWRHWEKLTHSVHSTVTWFDSVFACSISRKGKAPNFVFVCAKCDNVPLAPSSDNKIRFITILCYFPRVRAAWGAKRGMYHHFTRSYSFIQWRFSHLPNLCREKKARHQQWMAGLNTLCCAHTHDAWRLTHESLNNGNVLPLAKFNRMKAKKMSRSLSSSTALQLSDIDVKSWHALHALPCGFRLAKRGKCSPMAIVAAAASDHMQHRAITLSDKKARAYICKKLFESGFSASTTDTRW